MSKNIPGIVRKGRKRNEDKVRITLLPNTYPLEQPGIQPSSGPMTPPIQPSVQPNQMYPGGPGSMQPQMQPGGPGSMPPQMYPGGPGPMQPQMQPGAPGPMQPQMQNSGSGMHGPAPVVPMQSNGQWRSDPNAQAAPPYSQGNNNQTWQGAPQPQEVAGVPNMQQQPAQTVYNNQQQWAGNSQQQPTTPPPMQRPYTPLPTSNSTPMQQGHTSQPPYSNVPSQPPTPGQRFAPASQYSPELAQTPHTPALSQPIANPQYPPAYPEHTPMTNAPYQTAMGAQQPPSPPRAPSSGLLSHSQSGIAGPAMPYSQPGIAGPAASPSQSGIAGPAMPMASTYIEIDGKITQEVRLDRPVLTVGRQDGRDVQIKHQSVSRTHAKIVAENGTWVVEDAGSVNGIVFNGHRVHRTAVNNGDRVYIAPNIALIFKLA